MKPRVEVVTYHCEVCQAEIFHTVEGERFTPLKECPGQKCKDNKQAGKLRQNTRTSKFGKYQEIRVTEMSEHVPVGGVPRSWEPMLRKLSRGSQRIVVVIRAQAQRARTDESATIGGSMLGTSVAFGANLCEKADLRVIS